AAWAVPVAVGDHEVGQRGAGGAVRGGGQRVGGGGGGDRALGHRPGRGAAHGGERDLVGVHPGGGLGGGVGGLADELGGGQPGPQFLADEVGGFGAQDRAAGGAGVGDGGLVLPDRGLAGAPALSVQVADVAGGGLVGVGAGGGRGEEVA